MQRSLGLRRAVCRGTPLRGSGRTVRAGGWAPPRSRLGPFGHPPRSLGWSSPSGGDHLWIHRRWAGSTSATTDPPPPPGRDSSAVNAASSSPPTPAPAAGDGVGSSSTDAATGVAARGGDADDDLLVVEPLRWEQKDIDHDRIKDERGEYIVSRGKWHTGEIAYATPPPPSHLAPRFGYNIVQVKKGITYWQWYRKNPHFSIRHVGVHCVFMLGLAAIMTWLMEEIRRVEYEMKAPGAMAGEERGKGSPQGRNRKLTFSRDEIDDITSQLQESYMSGKEFEYRGNKDYVMQKIARPKEFSTADLQNVRRNPSAAPTGTVPSFK